MSIMARSAEQETPIRTPSLSSNYLRRPSDAGSGSEELAKPSPGQAHHALQSSSPTKYSDGLPVEVLFADGMSVKHIRTRDDISCITITNLPLDTKMLEMERMLSSRLKYPSLKLSPLESAPDGQSLLCSIALDHGDTQRTMDSLSQVAFKQVRLKYQVTPNGKEGHMLDTFLNDQTSPSDPSLTVTWDPPSVKAVVAVPSASGAAAIDAICRINETVLEGRRLRATLRMRKLARIFSPFRGSSWVMEIDSLPFNVTKKTIIELSGCSSVKSIKRRSYFVDLSLKRLERNLKAVVPGSVKEFCRNDSSALPDGSVSVTIRFHNWNQARQGYIHLADPQHRYFGQFQPRLDLAGPFRYGIHIPIQQYNVQKSSIDYIAKQRHIDDHDALICCMELESRHCMSLQVVGYDQKAVGALKVGLEKLVSGQKFYVWHGFFESDAADMFFKSVYKEKNVWATADKIAKFLKLFGEPLALASAKNMIKEKLDELGPCSTTFQLQEHSSEFLTVKDVRYQLQTPVEKARTSGIPNPHQTTAPRCPICLDDVANPVQLHCSHVCCDGCLRHFLATACDTRSFPLVCPADEGKCKIPVHMNIIQRYLTPTKMCQLFETAFSVYMDTHPQEYRYCSTSDCCQVYRVSEAASPATCTSCFSSTCACCHKEWHPRFTCKEWQAHIESNEKDKLFLQWTKKTKNVRMCPQCHIFIEKVDGCFKVQCHCKVMICWKCMGIFPKENIYTHMTVAHGGVFDDVPD